LQPAPALRQGRGTDTENLQSKVVADDGSSPDTEVLVRGLFGGRGEILKPQNWIGGSRRDQDPSKHHCDNS
jgi:hypothetical protein